MRAIITLFEHNFRSIILPKNVKSSKLRKRNKFELKYLHKVRCSVSFHNERKIPLIVRALITKIWLGWWECNSRLLGLLQMGLFLPGLLRLAPAFQLRLLGLFLMIIFPVLHLRLLGFFLLGSFRFLPGFPFNIQHFGLPQARKRHPWRNP